MPPGPGFCHMGHCGARRRRSPISSPWKGQQQAWGSAAPGLPSTPTPSAAFTGCCWPLTQRKCCWHQGAPKGTGGTPGIPLSSSQSHWPHGEEACARAGCQPRCPPPLVAVTLSAQLFTRLDLALSPPSTALATDTSPLLPSSASLCQAVLPACHKRAVDTAGSQPRRGGQGPGRLWGRQLLLTCPASLHWHLLLPKPSPALPSSQACRPAGGVAPSFPQRGAREWLLAHSLPWPGPKPHRPRAEGRGAAACERPRGQAW